MTEDRRSRLCPASLAQWLVNPIRSLLQSPRKILQSFVKPGMVVVDIGCGGGYFTVGLAHLVGAQGKVIAVDLQPEMLAFTRVYAEKKGVLSQITLHQCQPDTLGLADQKADFALAFYVVHEIRDHAGLFRQIRGLLNPDGRLLIFEPNVHVTKPEFARMVEVVKAAGFQQLQEVKLPLSRGVLFSIRNVK